MGESHDELVERAVAGDADALSTLLEEYGPQVRRKLVISPPWRSALDSADVMQVTYMEAFLRIAQLATRDAPGFAAWLAGLAQNNLRDAIKELKRRKRPDPRRRITAGPNEESYAVLLDAVGFTTHTASRSAAAREAQRLLQAAVARLPESYQKVVRLYDLEGRPTNEVAQALGRSPAAVYMLRARAHDRLHELLGSTSKFFSDRA